MIPERFSIELAERLMKLLEVTAAQARAVDLTTTHLLALAMPLLIVPLERMDQRATLREGDNHPLLLRALQRLRQTTFTKSQLWEAGESGSWWFVVVTGRDIESPTEWRTSHGLHPCADPAAQSINVSTEDVLLTMRHGLAHGNVVYLDEEGSESPMRRVTRLGFVARTRKMNGVWDGNYRVLIVEEDCFRSFLGRWAGWLARHADRGDYRFAA